MSQKTELICQVLITRMVIFEQLNQLDQVGFSEKPHRYDSLIVLPAIANIFPNPQLN